MYCESKSSEPTEEEAKWYVSIIEHYKCNKCLQQIRSPIYNHPIKLMTTKTGGKEEWVITFTCICRALGYKIRLVNNWQGQLWNEIYINQ